MGLELHERSIIPLDAPQPPPGATAPGELRKILVTNLRIRMAEVDINQRMLAEQAGVSQRHLSQIMTLASGVTLDVIEMLARALNTTAAALLTPRQ